MGTWQGSMLAALVATLGRPSWWSMALAAFFVRGGILLLLLPIIVLPTPAALANALAPTIEGFVFGGLSAERLLLVLATAGSLFVLLGGGGLAGAWLDQSQLREAAEDDELDLGWSPARSAVREALALRLAAHLPTLAVLAFATYRFVGAAYDELLTPSETATPVVLRVLSRAPDAALLLVAAWLAGETVGGLAARRSAAGAGSREALWRSARQLFAPRGLATLGLTTAVVAGVLVPFLFAAGRAMDHLRDVLTGDADFLQVGAALLVVVGSWILGLAVLGASLAWRGAAWTVEVAPSRGAIPEPSPAPATEASIG